MRRATLDDAEAIRTIYNYEVENSTATFDLVPRTVADQQLWLQDRAGALSAVVAVESGRVIGFSSLSHYKERAAYRTTVEDSVYVHRDFQGQGIGRALLTEICEIATANGFHAVMARIESTREASIATHTRCGFSVVGIEREVGRKFNRWLSVTLMQRLLG